MEILIVVVIYNKSIEEINFLEEIKDIDILIYDNSLNPQKVPEEFHYYHDKLNSGVSVAYNYGIKLAKTLNKDFIIVLDHDTDFSYEILDKYKTVANRFGEDYIYAPIIKGGEKIYSPAIEGKNKNFTQDTNTFKYQQVYNIRGKSLINSGLMIPLAVTENIGVFNEQIKLDFSDTYFIEKYKTIYHSVILIDIFLEHKLSGDEGNNKDKELSRFKYYCNGAKEFKKVTSDISRVRRLVFFRMIRLIIKYKTLTPFGICIKYYVGDSKV